MEGFQYEEIRKLIDTFREFGLDKYVELPQIAVMGDTSSGKSSVLSSISGIIFPSNSNLTTRCPTQLILSQGDEFEGSVQLVRYDKTLPTEKEKKIKSIEQVTKEIERLTEQIVKEGQHISDDSIVIKLRGPEYPDLTLTDLPGLVRAVSDNEDASIIPKIRDLVRRYLQQKRTIILMVIPANVDFHNTEILRWAEEEDPTGERTLGIITKPDIVDKGTEVDVIKLLCNQKKRLKEGYHCVKGRNQEDINNGVTIKQGLDKEMKFFSRVAPWNTVDKNLCGTINLKPRLIDILKKLISRELPEVLKEIEGLYRDTHIELNELGVSLTTDFSRRDYYNIKVKDYIYLLDSSIKGNYESKFFNELYNDETDNEDVILKNNKLRAHLRILDDVFNESITEHEDDKDPEANETKKLEREREMVEQIKSNRGMELSIFPSYQTFKNIVGGHVTKWEPFAEDIKTQYFEALQIVSNRALLYIKCKPGMAKHINEILGNVIEELKTEVDTALKSVMESELQPYTLSPKVFELKEKARFESMMKELDRRTKEKEKENKRDNISIPEVKELVRNLMNVGESAEVLQARDMCMNVDAYIIVSKDRFKDNIPITLNRCLLEQFTKRLNDKLSNINDSDLAKKLADPEHIMYRRKCLEEKLDSLRKGMEIIKLMEY